MGRLSRREIVQKLLSGIAMGAGMPWAASSHPIRRWLRDGETFDRWEEIRGAADGKPLFLSPEQDQALAALSETIVPGSAAAKVHAFIDLLLSVDTAEHQREFSGALAALEGEANKRFGRGFAALGAGEQVALLTEFSQQEAQRDEFHHLKEWVTGAYYSSEQGMRELGWNGNYAFESYPGCEHADH